MGMIFTEGISGAIETLMREAPGSNHYDDGCEGRYPECRHCRYHTPYSHRKDCFFKNCPYLLPDSSRTKKGGEQDGGISR